jgi:hypothetical protein
MKGIIFVNLLRQIFICDKLNRNLCLKSQELQVFDSIGRQCRSKPANLDFEEIVVRVIAWHRVGLITITKSSLFFSAVIVPMIP